MTDMRKWAAIGTVLVVSFLLPARALLFFVLSGDHYNTYILLIPVISGLLIYFDRRRIFQSCRYSPWLGGALGIFGIAILLWAGAFPASQNGYRLSMCTLSAVVTGAAGFLVCFGTLAFRRAAFPLAILVLAVPVPVAAMDQIFLALQNGSAACSTILFKVLNVPALRQGTRFSLPGLEIEIGEGCSGARSVLAFCIVSMLVSRLFIRTWWKQLLLVSITVPLVIFKNAVRIVTIATLAVYVDRGFLHGHLHNDWGLVFSLFDLVILAPIAVVLHRSDEIRQEPYPRSEAHSGEIC